MMGLFGLWVASEPSRHAMTGSVPEPATMGVIGVIALLVNAGVALMLYKFRPGHANMRAVWVCSRNDALGNLPVRLAARGVFATGTPSPELAGPALVAGMAPGGAVSASGPGRTGQGCRGSGQE